MKIVKDQDLNNQMDSMSIQSDFRSRIEDPFFRKVFEDRLPIVSMFTELSSKVASRKPLVDFLIDVA